MKNSNSITKKDLKKIKAGVDKLTRALSKSNAEVASLKKKTRMADKSISTLEKDFAKSASEMAVIKAEWKDMTMFFETAEISESCFYYDRDSDTYSFVTDVDFNGRRSKLTDISIGVSSGVVICKCRRADGENLILDNEIIFNNETITGYESIFRFEIWHSRWSYILRAVEIKGAEDEPPGM